MSDSHILADRCLQHFRHGFDTVEIAKRFGISEARASRLLWVARSHAKNLPADYVIAGGKIIRRVRANFARAA